MIKYLVLIVFISAGCIWLEKPAKAVDVDPICILPISDTVAMIPYNNFDTVPITSECDAVIFENSLLRKRIDSLNTALFISGYKVERVRYYLKIVNRKPSQLKFFKGWITRAVK
jgi:hypothetical protein